jgi:hypothetical protein
VPVVNNDMVDPVRTGTRRAIRRRHIRPAHVLVGWHLAQSISMSQMACSNARINSWH